ncbi:MAG TPA: site-2 protease family protein [Candidatus Diapherotrites archaeon]|nr:site-2 protease family protein [Candidatus Diapherotrites archaeon]
MSTIAWILLIILIIVLSAQFAKRVLKKETYLGIFILVKTQKLIKYLKNLSKFKKILNILADIGIVLGFGAFGFDYLFKDKYKNKKWKRITVFVITTLIFSAVTYFLAYGMLFKNVLIPKFFGIIIMFCTGIMGLSGFTLSSLVFSAYDIISKIFVKHTVACAGVGLVIPGVQLPKTPIFIPWYGWIILIIAAMIHEFSHGAMLAKMKVKIKSMGVILASILPLGAFVEPDDKEVKKQKNKEIVRMYSAGPTSNTFLAAIFFIILFFITPGISKYMNSVDQNAYYPGVYITNVTPETSVCGTISPNPAYGKLQAGDLIISANGKTILTSSDLTKAINQQGTNTFVVQTKDTNIIRTETIVPNELGKLGFTAESILKENYVKPPKYNFYKNLYNIIFWFALLNFVIATVNFLPTIPFDGGFMSQVIFSEYLNKKTSKKKRMKKVSKFFGTLIILLLILNIIPYFL